MPIQNKIVRSFDKIFGVDNSVTIKPFALDEVDGDRKETVQQ